MRYGRCWRWWAPPRRISRRGLTLVHFSAQPEPFSVTEALELPSVFLKRCFRGAEKWTNLSPCFSAELMYDKNSFWRFLVWYVIVGEARGPGSVHASAATSPGAHTRLRHETSIRTTAQRVQQTVLASSQRADTCKPLTPTSPDRTPRNTIDPPRSDAITHNTVASPKSRGLVSSTGLRWFYQTGRRSTGSFKRRAGCDAGPSLSASSG